MKIEKIIKLKSGKYKIFLDNNEQITTFDDVILNNNLLFHKEIDNDIYVKIKEENNYYELLNSSIKYISKRLRSEKEIKIYLEKKTTDIYLIDSIIDNLKSQKLIDDRNFSRAYINDKLNLTNTGILKLKKDNNKLEKMIIRKIKTNHKYSNKMLKEKILNDMTNLGYDYESIINIYDKFEHNDEDIYNREYQKIYNKLKNKYQGRELELNIKKKLYSKGFINK